MQESYVLSLISQIAFPPSETPNTIAKGYLETVKRFIKELPAIPPHARKETALQVA
jgi:hypothetical protein